MRIDLNAAAANEVSAEQNTKQVKGGASTAHSVPSEDRATFTSDTVSVSSLAAQALQSPEVRQDKVEALRQSVQSGDYELDSTKTAGAILDEHA